MKTKGLLILLTLLATVFSSCNKDDKKPEDKSRVYPEGAIVWKKDTIVTLTDHYVVPVNKSLFIEEGVQIIMNDTAVRPEFIVLGNLYCYGTAEKPIRFTVAEQYRSNSKKFNRYWGGIICGYDCEEVLLQHTIVEYGGAQTTEESASFQYQLFKTVTGEGVPGFHFCNPEGRFVITNCTFMNNAEDQVYITGGQSIIMNSQFICNGYDGGDAINYKSDCLADLAYNFIYDPNTNGFKLSNSGMLNTQSDLYVYNNTLVNTGWRRPKIKDGSIWLEDNIKAHVFNNILFDTRHPIKQDVKKPMDSTCVYTPNFIFASTQAGIDEFVATEKNGVLNGANDKMSTTPGTNNPNFESFTIQSNVDIMAGVNGSSNVPQQYNSTWDFHLKTGSPALTGGNITITPHYNTNGLTIDNVTYKSPAPAAYFGAYGTK